MRSSGGDLAAVQLPCEVRSLTWAKGLWILSSGVAQVEDILIVELDGMPDKLEGVLSSLARKVRETCDQEAVAYEVGNELRFAA